MAKKKLQIFISSTFKDLEEERQAAVEAILGSKHIPAGMELFKAGNTSQLETIKKWINESDLYMLILGGRYGSIEPKTGKSYTQLEYEYALEKKIPVFAVVLDESFLYEKAAKKQYEVFETDNKDKYIEFKKFVMTKIVKVVEDCKDIQIAIKDSISELENDYPLCGWVRASEVEDSTEIIKENNKLLKENEKLKSQLQKVKDEDKIGKFDYEELKKVLKKKVLNISGVYFEDKKDLETNYLEFFVKYKNIFVIGITNAPKAGIFQKHIFNKISPFLISFGLLEINKITGVIYRRLEISKVGLDFIARLEFENSK